MLGRQAPLPAPAANTKNTALAANVDTATATNQARLAAAGGTLRLVALCGTSPRSDMDSHRKCVGHKYRSDMDSHRKCACCARRALLGDDVRVRAEFDTAVGAIPGIVAVVVWWCVGAVVRWWSSRPVAVGMVGH